MYNLLKTCVKQPVIAIVLSLVVIVLGLVGFQRLELRFFPELKVPMVTVNTSFPGASADLMENEVTTIIENALSGVNGVESIISSSDVGRSNIIVMFKLGGDFEQQVNDIRDKVSGVKDRLPPDAYASTISVGGNADPVMGIGIMDKNKSTTEIRDYVARAVQPVLRQLPGVGGVGVLGSTDYAMRIWLNSAKMASLGITVTDIKTALTANNIDFSGGYVRTPDRNYSIVARTRLKNADDFAKIIVKQDDSGTARLSDVADVELGYSGIGTVPLRINGQDGVEVVVDPLMGANPITVASEVEKSMVGIQKNLLPGMSAKINYNNATFLKRSVNETFAAIIEAVLLVILVVFIFLGSMRSSLIPIVTIPVSLLGVFGVIYLFGFSINVMSLLGIVLAIGLVVDDAIVMLENIHRHLEQGMVPMEAALRGSREIAMAVVAMGLTLAAVYAPLGLMQGFTAKLFQQFAFTLAGAVVISAFVALTLTPMMCSRILHKGGQEGRFAIMIDKAFERLSHSYQAILKFMLHKRIFVVIALVVIAIFGGFLYREIPSEFIPQEDIGMFNVDVTAPDGASVNYVSKYSKKIEAMVAKIPQVEAYITNTTGSAQITVILKPWGVRKVSTESLVEDLNKKLSQIPGVDADAYVPDIVDYGVKGHDIVFNIMTIGDYNDLLDPINKMMNTLKRYPGVVNVNTNLKFDKQQYAITIKRDIAANLGVNIQDIADTISAMLGGVHVGDVQAGGNRSYQVLVQLQQSDLSKFDAINQLYVRSTPPASTDPSKPAAVGTMIPLSSLVEMKPIIGQSSLSHFNRLRSGQVTARLAPGYSESQVIEYIQKVALTNVPHNLNTAFYGKAQQFLDSQGSMTEIALLALVFIYLVLSAQFTSFLDPIIILVAVPLSIVGALFSLKVSGGTLNLYSQIGLVTLVGMISKHGILITQFINQKREEGMEMMEAIVVASTVRLRPILMTTSAMVFGTFPLAFATGPGSIGRHQIGWVVIGGLLFGTFFSLIVVPVTYSYLGKFKKTDK